VVQEAEMTVADKKTLKQSIKLSLIIALLFCVASVFIVAIIPTVMFLIGRDPAAGFVTRGLYILGLLFIPFLAISWKSLLKFIDIQQGKKLRTESPQFEIQKTKNTLYIRTFDNKEQRFEIWEELVPLLDLTQPIIIETGKISKEIIFISNNTDNLLDK
jgi:hypothetical protein